MQPQDSPAFMAIINGLAAMKPGAKITPEALDMWWAAMKDWPLDEFRSAANHLAKLCEFMPNPYHFEQLRKASAETPGEAFARARQIVRRLNPRELISHSSGDARLDSAIRACGGYEALAMCESDNIGFFERRFASHYETISDASDVREALPALSADNPMKSLAAMKRINVQ